EVGPGQLQPHPAAVDAQPVVTDPTVRGIDTDPHLDQLLDRPRGETVAADLLPGEGRLLQHEHVEPGLREVVRRGRAAGPGTDDDDVGRTVRCLAAHARLASLASLW